MRPCEHCGGMPDEEGIVGERWRDEDGDECVIVAASEWKRVVLYDDGSGFIDFRVVGEAGMDDWIRLDAAADAPVNKAAASFDRQPTLHDLARRAAEVNAANGWEPANWDNLVPKLAFALTEVDELIDGLHADDEENIREETADIVIRVASALYDWREDDWCSRVEHRQRITSGRYAPPEALVRPISSHLLRGVEAWRNGKHKDVQQHMELALLCCYRLSDQLRFDLNCEVERKIEINRGRGRHHGKAQGVG